MAAFYKSIVRDFLLATEQEVVGQLSVAYATEGYESLLSDATLTWVSDLKKLRAALKTCAELKLEVLNWTLLLEFVIPRKEKRIDVVLIAGPILILLEQKTHAPARADFDQVEEYGVLLHYFHQPSRRRKIVPVVVSDRPRVGSLKDMLQTEFPFEDSAAYWVQRATSVTWQHLPEVLLGTESDFSDDAIDPNAWEKGDYFPVPSIIEAARSLQAGLKIPSIAHSRAAEHDISNLTDFVRNAVNRAKSDHQHVICFVTGVPGSGKTLVGLNLAFSSRGDGDSLHFMSGNGPLVSVLQALFKDFQRNFRGVSARDAEIEATTLVENVHAFAKTYTQTTPDSIPSNHVVIFDEAQRAWDLAQSRRKFSRETSEPAMFLRIMERHDDWAVIIALVGGGQEINDGEAGLSEWGRALADSNKSWRILASPEVISGGDSVAGGKLVEDASNVKLVVEKHPQLHLKVSVRSLEAEGYSKWVNMVIAGRADSARNLERGGFPVYLSRSLSDVRAHLRRQALGMSRYGLIGSSKATRLRAQGLEPDSSFHGNYDWSRWYLAPDTDVRSSNQMEVFATEFEIQGLELDWIGLCWGGDFIWSKKNAGWITRKFRNSDISKWTLIRNQDQQEYRRNSYRVLLTRARQDLILYIPLGLQGSSIESAVEFDETADFLLTCGALPLEIDGPQDTTIAGLPFS